MCVECLFVLKSALIYRLYYILTYHKMTQLSVYIVLIKNISLLGI